MTELERLREIGWAEWDPIGLRTLCSPRDEYDPYLTEAAARLRAGDLVGNVAAYLDQIVEERMALDPRMEGRSAASLRTATLIRSCIVGHQP